MWIVLGLWLGRTATEEDTIDHPKSLYTENGNAKMRRLSMLFLLVLYKI